MVLDLIQAFEITQHAVFMEAIPRWLIHLPTVPDKPVSPDKQIPNLYRPGAMFPFPASLSTIPRIA
jgi:hypothetical protein